MGMNYKPGTWNVICDVCGFEFKSDQIKERWDGHMVCEKDFETRHPMDFYRVTSQTVYPSWSRPEAEDIFISVTYVDEATAIAGIAVAGVAITGRDIPGVLE